MSPSLAVLVLSLAAAASPWEALLDQKPPTNAERAKRGLLPRRSHPSRVTYLEGAARRRGEVREFSALAPPPAAVPEVTRPPAAPDAAPPPATPPEPERRREEPVRVAAAEPIELMAVAAEPAAPAPTAAASVAAEEAADRARDARAASEPLVVERSIDGRGRILERRLGRDLRVLSVRVAAVIDELPVLSSVRTENGEIVERVEDRGRVLEVRRDPVGRFRSARPLPPPSEDEGD